MNRLAELRDDSTVIPWEGRGAWALSAVRTPHRVSLNSRSVPMLNLWKRTSSPHFSASGASACIFQTYPPPPQPKGIINATKAIKVLHVDAGGIANALGFFPASDRVVINGIAAE